MGVPGFAGSNGVPVSLNCCNDCYIMYCNADLIIPDRVLTELVSVGGCVLCTSALNDACVLQEEYVPCQLMYADYRLHDAALGLSSCSVLRHSSSNLLPTIHIYLLTLQ